MTRTTRLTALCAFMLGLGFSVQAFASDMCNLQCFNRCLREQIYIDVDACNAMCGCSVGTIGGLT